MMISAKEFVIKNTVPLIFAGVIAALTWVGLFFPNNNPAFWAAVIILGIPSVLPFWIVDWLSPDPVWPTPASASPVPTSVGILLMAVFGLILGMIVQRLWRAKRWGGLLVLLGLAVLNSSLCYLLILMFQGMD